MVRAEIYIYEREIDLSGNRHTHMHTVERSNKSLSRFKNLGFQILATYLITNGRAVRENDLLLKYSFLTLDIATITIVIRWKASAIVKITLAVAK